MKPIEFKEHNCVHKADGCIDLPTRIIKNKQFGVDEITSCWELEDADVIKIIESLSKGERPVIYLSVIGGQPPISLFTEI